MICFYVLWVEIIQFTIRYMVKYYGVQFLPYVSSNAIHGSPNHEIIYQSFHAQLFLDSIITLSTKQKINRLNHQRRSTTARSLK